MTKSGTQNIKRLLADHPTLAGWSDTLSDVLQQIRQGTPGKYEAFGGALIGNLNLMLTSLPSIASTDDELEDVAGEIPTLDVHSLSKRFGVIFGMGLELRSRSIYLSAEMLRPAQLWRVPAEFWEQMASLSRCCDDVTYEPCVSAPVPPDSTAIRHLQHSKCALFRMIANYTMLKAQETLPEPECGGVKVRWSWGTDIEPLMTGAAGCFERLSRMNWLLYRLNYGDTHARRAKAQR